MIQDGHKMIQDDQKMIQDDHKMIQDDHKMIQDVHKMIQDDHKKFCKCPVMFLSLWSKLKTDDGYHFWCHDLQHIDTW